MVYRAVLHKELLIDFPLVRRKLLYAAIEKQIDKEWYTMWNESTTRKDAQEAFSIAGGQWLGEETMTHEQQTLLARFLMGSMHLKSIHLPRYDVSDVFCPTCGYELNRMHAIEECRGLDAETLDSKRPF